MKNLEDRLNNLKREMRSCQKAIALLAIILINRSPFGLSMAVIKASSCSCNRDVLAVCPCQDAAREVSLRLNPWWSPFILRCIRLESTEVCATTNFIQYWAWRWPGVSFTAWPCSSSKFSCSAPFTSWGNPLWIEDASFARKCLYIIILYNILRILRSADGNLLR